MTYSTAYDVNSRKFAS